MPGSRGLKTTNYNSKAMNLRLLSTVTTGLSVALLALLLLRGCDKPETAPKDETEWRTVVDSLNREISDRDRAILNVRQKRAVDSLENLRVTTGLKKREAALVAKLKEAKADIQEIADSIPKVARYVHLTDSTIAVKDSLYNHEVERRLSEESSFRYEIDELGKKNVQQVQLSEEYKARAESSERKLQRSEKRLERKKLGNRILLGVAAGLGAAVAVMSLSQ